MKKFFGFGLACVALVFVCSSVLAQKTKMPDVDKKTEKELTKLLEEKKYEELEKKARAGLEKKKSYTLRYFLAMALYSQGKSNDETKKLFEDLISANAYEFEANSRLAVMHIEENNYETGKKYALRAVEVGTEKKDELARAYHNAGVCFEKMKDRKKAISYYEKAIETNPEYWESYLAIGSNHYELGNYGSALECMEKYVEKQPNGGKSKMAQAFEIMSYCAGQIGNNEKSEKYAKRGLEIDPKNKNFAHYLADIYAKKGQWQNFAETWKTCHAANPADGEAPY